MGKPISDNLKKECKMNKMVLLFLVVVLLVLIGLGRLCSYLNKRMYDDCMAAGVQSQETCYEYSYLQ